MSARSTRFIRTFARFVILQFAICNLLAATPALSYADGSSLAAREEAALNAAAERVAPSVVQIRTIGGLDVVDGTLLADGPTTGLVISPDGYILSSAFNFAQQPASILVTLSSGRQVPAKLIATDHSRMLVLLKAEGAADLAVPEFAPPAEAKPGQWAVAIGRTFRAERINVTVGIISAVGRMYGKAIQTDADVSTANYGGPLVDIRGRVVGLIVPMSPQATSEVAGTEWYDSGIGFAVPLAPLAERIERMKKGEDQRAGLLGIGMKTASAHSAPAQLSVVRPDSPAGQAGFKKGDRIIEVEGKPIRTQSDLRFALGTAYGGDSVRVVAKRGNDRVEGTVKLAGELAPFRHAFLGILPMRVTADENDTEESGIVVRTIYPGSPAAEAGIQAGDRVTQINDATIKSIDDAIQALNNVAPDNKVSVRALRKESSLDLTLTATRLPTSVPGDLPPATAASADPDANIAAGETTELKLPEFPHTCHVYVPGALAENAQLAALLWIQSSGDAKSEDVLRSWKLQCDRNGIVLIVPKPAKADHWERTDLEYLRLLLERAIGQYKIDPRRVVVGGQGAAGSIAWPLALVSRNMVRGIGASAAPLSRQIKVPQNDPAQRLAIFATIPPKKEVAAQIALGLKSISDAGYNVTTTTTQSPTGDLTENERDDLANWIDTLDSF
jgi:S1-C subfamily serine protease